MKHYKLNEIPEEKVTDLFARKFFTGDKITFAFLNMKKGCVVPLHHHESEQFSYCISGALQFKIGDEELTLKAGEMVQIPSNVPHEATRFVRSPLFGTCTLTTTPVDAVRVAVLSTFTPSVKVSPGA